MVMLDGVNRQLVVDNAGCENIVEIMCDSSSQATQCLQFLELADLVIQSSPLLDHDALVP